MTKLREEDIIKSRTGEGTHHKKRRPKFAIYRKGETPIEKNVRVIDGQGNEYEATWPKRAKQLVKQGRARFLSENLICLACPPNFDLEDNIMLENDTMPKTETTEATGITETVETPAAPEAPEAPKANTVDLDYILKQISTIQEDTALLKETLTKVAVMGSEDATKICAMKEMVIARETTNQQLLDFYIALYNDQKRPIVDPEWVENTARSAGEAARKAGKAAKETAKDWGGKFKDWFKEVSEEDWDGKVKEQIRKAKTRSLKEKVLNALQSPTLNEESREALLDYMGQLKTFSPEMQDQALDILTNPQMGVEEKTLILENLDAINRLDD